MYTKRSTRTCILLILVTFIRLSAELQACEKKPGDSSTLNTGAKQKMLLTETKAERISRMQADRRSTPEGYCALYRDDFVYFNENTWSRGLEDDTPGSDKALIWNPQTGGAHLLNDNYAGYITDEDAYIDSGALHLRNQARSFQGDDPAGTFDYTSGWVNSLGKLKFNGTHRAVFIELQAKFPVGYDVWPAIWLVTDARRWPPEIDIWEYFGKFFTVDAKVDMMALRYIYGHWQDKEDLSKELVGFDAQYDISEWHRYGWEWTDSHMRWFVDGKLIHTFTRGDEIPHEEWPDEDFSLVMNNGVMRVNAGAGAVYPNHLVIDYIDIWQGN
jgi:beta-glucanase (GH16 family)